MAAPVIIKLTEPVEFGSTMIETLELKPTGRAMRGLTLPMEKGKLDYQPWPLAVVGLKMAGHVATAETIADRLSPADLTEVANTVLGFFAGSQTGGSTT
jgi:hypothetical protein